MAHLDEHCASKLHQLESQHLRRRLRVSAHVDDSAVEIEQDGRRFVSFACNDYLGLRAHPAVVAAGANALAEYGAGAGASRLITGNHPLYAPLEAKLAAMKGTEAALVFGSGYLTNLGVIPALMQKGDVIFADKLVHACIIDAAQLSGARLIRFKHNDMAHLEALLKEHREESPNALIVTDHVFSMDGDVAPLAEMAALGEKYDAWTMADDAHGLGVVPPPRGGRLGGGHCEHFASHESLSFPSSSRVLGTPPPQPSPSGGGRNIDIWMGTLSKSAGSYGGYVCGSQVLMDYLITSARSFVFSTGLPPSVCASALAALEVMEAEPERGLRALELAKRVTDALGVPPAQSAIVPVILGAPEAAIAAADSLKEKGLLAMAIRPPTVPAGTARLRLAFSCEHTDAQVEALIEALKKLP